MVFLHASLLASRVSYPLFLLVVPFQVGQGAFELVGLYVQRFALTGQLESVRETFGQMLFDNDIRPFDADAAAVHERRMDGRRDGRERLAVGMLVPHKAALSHALSDRIRAASKFASLLLFRAPKVVPPAFR